MMHQELVQIALVVNNYDEALDFYTKKLNFILIEDTVLSESKRWVVIQPPGGKGCKILLAQAATDEQKNCVGKQAGGRVFLFLHTDNLNRDYEYLLTKEINIIRKPTAETWGKVLVFADLYGNLWDLIEPN